jgi:hypothetical protein
LSSSPCSCFPAWIPCSSSGDGTGSMMMCPPLRRRTPRPASGSQTSLAAPRGSWPAPSKRHVRP